MSSSRSIAVLLSWLWQAQLRHQPGRLLLAVLSIGVGVALALAIHLVNRSALAEFAASIAQVNGEAQAQLIARADRFDEAVLARVASVHGVAVASPVLDREWRVLDAAGSGEVTAMASKAAGERPVLRVVGLDPLRASAVTPALVPSVSETSASLAGALFAPDAIFLSRAALAQLSLAVGDRLRLLVVDRPVMLTVRGTVEGVGSGQVLAVMDIGTMQWRLGELGRLSRIDLQFDGERDLASVRRDIEALLPAEVLWSGPQAAVQRMSNLSRAYRVNLNVLALVALFTGVFIVHSALALMVARQAGEQALLRVLGASTRLPAAWVLGIALLIGMLGAGLGVAGGIGLGHLMLQLTRGDLGGGYFSGATVMLEIDAAALLLALAGGLAAALAGAWGPVRSAARLRPSAALRGSGGEALLDRPDRTITVLALAGCGLLLLAAPPIAGLPIAAYLAIALLLLAGILASPRLLAPLARKLADTPQAARAGPLPWLALQRMAGTPGQTATAFAGVVASIALASAMAIMVTSFRTSVESWLDQVLPADLYGRAGGSRSAATLGPETQQAMAALPGAARTRFTRQLPLLIDPTQPPVTLIARDFGNDAPGERLPLTGALRAAPPGAVPAWITEAVVDLHDLRPGDWLELPIGSSGQALRVFVSGVWRDYSRQHGAIVIERETYRQHTGDDQANEVAWWLEPGTDPDRFVQRLREISPAAAALEFRDTFELKTLSLKIFDRSFAVTYALEAIAIAVALFGAASSRAAEALARQKEFGMLRHLGLGRRQVGIAFTLEAAIGAFLSSLWGIALGAVVAAILVHRVNPQSFHWTMSMHWPTGLIAASLVATVVLAALAAAWVSRQAMGPGPLAAVRADW
jgi:putative ABC transport system permease protein